MNVPPKNENTVTQGNWVIFNCPFFINSSTLKPSNRFLSLLGHMREIHNLAAATWMQFVKFILKSYIHLIIRYIIKHTQVLM